MRQPDFDALAMALPLPLFKALMSRDDLTCNSEADIIRLVERYIDRKPKDQYQFLREELVPVIRLDKLSSD
jgi:hypothetical protein